MAIIKNSKNVIGVYKNGTPMIKVYKGSNLVWQLTSGGTDSPTGNYQVRGYFDGATTSIQEDIFNPTELSEIYKIEVDGVEVNKNTLTRQDLKDGNEHIIDFYFYRPYVPESLFDGYSSGVGSAWLGFDVMEGITHLYPYAFRANDMSWITLPSTLEYISTAMFFRCNNLSSITFNSQTAPTFSSEDNQFLGVAETGTVYYPCDGTGYEFISDTLVGMGWTDACNLKYDVTATFNVTDTSTAMQIFRGASSSASSAWTTSSLTTMYIDDEEVTPTLTYTFPTTGEHTVGYNFVDNTQIPTYAFYRCTSAMTSVKIRDNITSINERAFSYCSGLTEVVIPDSVTSIGVHAFSYCQALPSIEIPNGVTSIGGNAFISCASLTELVIPDSVTSLGVLATSANTSLTAVTIGSGVTNLQAGTLNSVPNLKYLKIGNGMTSLTGTWGSNGYNPTSSGIGFFVTGAKSPFQGCTALTEVILPETLTEMSGPVFMYCDQLESITIPSSVTALTDYSYSQGGSYGCFQNCTSLREVTFEGNTAPEIGEHTFPNGNAGTVYYPCGSDYTSVMNQLSMWTDGCTGSSNLSSIYIRAEYTSAGKSAVNQSYVGACASNYGINPVQAIVWYNESGEVIDSGASDYYITTSSNVLSPNYAKIYINDGIMEYETDIDSVAAQLVEGIASAYEVVDESGLPDDGGAGGDDGGSTDDDDEM